jgi:hypothetical protein
LVLNAAAGAVGADKAACDAGCSGDCSPFGVFDPFGNFDLLFAAARLNLKIVDVPIRCHERTYGTTNTDRWRHGALLLKMAWFAARRMKMI